MSTRATPPTPTFADRLPLGRRVLAGFGLALAVLLGVGAASGYTIDRFVQRADDALRQAEIVVPLNYGLSQMYEVGAAQRGYFLTASSGFLAQRDAASQAWARSLVELRRAAAERPALLERIDALQALGDARLRRLDEVKATHARSPDEARRLLADGYGSAEMQALADAANTLADEQQRLLQSNAQAARDGSLRVLWAFGLAMAAAAVLLLWQLRAILRGIADRQRAHAALSDGEARLRAVVDTAHDGIVVFDGQGRIERFNRSAERLFGWGEDEVRGHDVSLLVPALDGQALDGPLQRDAHARPSGAIGADRQADARRKDGSVVPVEFAVTETQVGGQRLFTAMIRDVSERRQAEQRQAQLMQELRAANEELGNFAYVASHDLKAPLRAIGSLARWVADDYGDRLGDEGRSQMALLLNRVKRMDRLIDGILQYSRVGRVREAPSLVDLHALVRDTVDLLAPPPNVTVEVAPLPQVRIEATRAQQLFQNLLANAIQYMDKPQGWVGVACDDEATGWHFRVTDNGPGIEPRHWDRVFQLFQSLKTRDTDESTGIGLSLVKKIVELYGGRIWIASEPGRGCTFHFTLPKAAS